MSILSSNRLNENQISHSISNFLSNFQVIRLFRACGGDKAKGISVECLFAYILSNVFHASSFYIYAATRFQMAETFLQEYVSRNLSLTIGHSRISDRRWPRKKGLRS